MIKKNLINKLISFLSILHFGVSITVIIFPIICTNKKILNLIFNYMIVVILGWMIFDGRCWLSDIERLLYKVVKKKTINEDNILVQYFYSWFGIKVNDKFIDKLFWILTYTSIVILSYRLDNFNQGFYLLFGWILFKMALDNSKK